MRGLVFLMIGFTAAISPSHAAGAAFAEDGKTVYLMEDGGIVAIDTETGGIAKQAVKGIGEIEGISRADNGAFYLVSEKVLWRWTPGTQKAVMVESAAKGRFFSDVACNSKTGEVLLVGEFKDKGGDERCYLLYKPDAKTAFAGVWLRYLPDAFIKAPEFMPDGTLLFSAEGDLWHGLPGIEQRGKDGPMRADITAYRYAPLAMRSTYSGTPAQFGIRDIAYGAGHVYVQLGRINGGEGLETLKLEAPALRVGTTFQEHTEIEDSIRVLKSAVKVGGDFTFSFLCASPDRTKVYMAEHGTRFTAEADYNDGEPIPFRIGDKILHPK